MLLKYIQLNRGIIINGMMATILLLFQFIDIHSQVGIGTPTPDASAAVDIVSNNSGILIPRSDTATINAAVTPATGLLIYQTLDNLFYFHNGVKWVALRTGEINRISDNDNDTWIDVENTIDEDTIRINVKGNEFIKLDGKSIHASAPGESLFIGLDAGKIDDGTDNKNTFVGIKAGLNNTSGFNNIYIGHKAGMSNNSHQNVMIGNNSGSLNDVGLNNTFLGYNSGGKIASKGSHNTLIGSHAGPNVAGFGSLNTFLGSEAGFSSGDVYRNTYLGASSGALNNSGTGNIFIGHQSGYNESGSEKLYIANTSTSHPLIYGEFNNNYLEVNGDININRGEILSGLTRKLTLSGARSSFGNPFAEIIFNNFDDDVIDVEYPGAKISSQNQGGFSTGDLRFWTTNVTVPTEKMIITHEGLIGIGTSDPIAMLHLKGGNLRADRGSTTSGLTRFINIGGARSDSGSDYAQLRFDNYDADHSAFNITRAMISSTNSNAQGNGDLRFHTYNGTLNEVMRIEGEGNVGIGNINPSHPLELSSGAHVTAAGVWTNSSDLTKKTNIKDLTYGLEEVLNMKPSSYEYKIDGSKSIGFIAQEMENIIPEVVSGEEGNKGIAYGLLVSTLVNAVKEQQDIIDLLNLKYNTQQSELNSIKQKLSDLELMIKEAIGVTQPGN